MSAQTEWTSIGLNRRNSFKKTIIPESIRAKASQLSDDKQTEFEDL